MSRVFVDRFGLTKPLDRAVAEAFEWVHASKIITPTSRVFVKPNLTWRKPTPGVTVTPAFLRAIVGALSDLTPFVTKGGSEGRQACFQAEETFETHGLYDLEREYGVCVVN
jgi:uncharacterized protein (DUF362 family)